MKLDLHIHTNQSDGILSPKEVVDEAIRRNLDGIAITDHDVISGIDEAINYAKNRLKIIPGIEFGAVEKNSEVHILGYFIDYKDPDLLNLCEKLKSSRVDRAKKIIKKLNELKINIEYRDLKLGQKDSFIGRLDIAKIMVEKGVVSTTDEAFNKYLGFNKPAYAERFRLSIKETIEFIKKKGGIAVLAHPGLLKNKSILYNCIEYGIDGLECYHSKHSKIESDIFLKIAKENNLIITGGSDCHGLNINGDLLMGSSYINIISIDDLRRRYSE